VPRRRTANLTARSFWIGLSSSVIIFNKWILDRKKFGASLLKKL
jgi:hypothetical protein